MGSPVVYGNRDKPPMLKLRLDALTAKLTGPLNMSLSEAAATPATSFPALARLALTSSMAESRCEVSW